MGAGCSYPAPILFIDGLYNHMTQKQTLKDKIKDLHNMNVQSELEFDKKISEKPRKPKKFLDLFNLTKKHFRDGVALFDEIPLKNIDLAVSLKGCEIDLHRDYWIAGLIIIVGENPELTFFGKITADGVIKIEGFSGIPMSLSCVDRCNEILPYAKRSKVSTNGIFMDFVNS